MNTPNGTKTNGTPDSLYQKSVLDDATDGYIAQAFDGKREQMEKVMDLLEEKGFLPGEFVESETKWFYTSLGIDDMYFKYESVQAISNNILSLYAGKVAAFSRDDGKLLIQLDRETENNALYIDTSTPGISVLTGPCYEKRIDEKYLNQSNPECAYRVETFRAMTPMGNASQRLRCYFVYKCDFVNPDPPAGETDISVISDKLFLDKVTPTTKDLYQNIISQVTGRTGPVIKMYEIKGTREKRIVIGFKQGTSMSLFSALSDLYHYYGCTSARKYVEQFSNGVTIYSIYLTPLPIDTKINTRAFPPIESSIFQILKEISLLYCIPQNMFQNHFIEHRLSLQETIYAHCVCLFAGHFMNRLGPEYAALTTLLDSENNIHADTLNKFKKRLRQETFTTDVIFEAINSHPLLIRLLYLRFASMHYVQTRGADDDFLPTLSYQRLQVDRVMTKEELQEKITTDVTNEIDEKIMRQFLNFNDNILKTNFYTPTKVALSFRLSPNFLPEAEYPQPLYGMFMVIGSEFRGFHLRFRDIARGGIRIVKSRNEEAYRINARSIFDENYNLANTQQRKNKDIPEGGGKGVVLLDADHQDKEVVAFQKYIDSILDLLLPPTSPGIKDPIVDLHAKPEILFMGPDENTAGLVNWATMHAKSRGASWWKSFFTGKSPTLGGIPHDSYGMTSLSVRECILGIYRKLNIDPSAIRKLQTGGPDGDLGSNEIFLSNEKYYAVIDGSGVLVDPKGISIVELKRLAKMRAMVSHFDLSKLSEEGYRVLCDETNIKLPSGEVVPNGTIFRNTFHLRSENKYDIMVPCGGRPDSIHLGNCAQLIDEDGVCLVPYIVEGANLFITQDAKLRLEKAGAVVFKDATANKGGVTSSSMEVLASLAFDDAGFKEHMCVKDGVLPEFYKSYVKTVQETIQKNARLEFECIWKENEETGVSRSILSDELSLAITKLDEELQKTDLWNNVPLRTSVLKEALPGILLEKIGLDALLERIPNNYLRAIFGSFLASRFIYEYGTKPSQFAFFDFMSKKLKTLEQNHFY